MVPFEKFEKMFLKAWAKPKIDPWNWQRSVLKSVFQERLTDRFIYKLTLLSTKNLLEITIVKLL